MTDLVAILDAETLELLFDGSNPMRVTVRETSKLTSWPVEDGTQRTDHRVLDPIEIDLPLLLTGDNRDLFSRLRQAFIEGRLLVVQTQMRSYDSMMIMDMPHDEIPEQGDSTPVAVKLKEIKTVKPEFGALPQSQVANPQQSSTVKKGGQQTTEVAEGSPSQRKASALYKLAN